MKSYDILIVGNSVMGLSVAYALALEAPSLKIGVIGPQDRAGAATIAAGAMLGCFGEVTKTNFNSTPGKAKFELNLQATKMWPAWLNQINSSIGTKDYIKTEYGTHVILNSRSGTLDCESYNAILKTLQFYDEPYQEIDPATVPGLNPIADCRPTRALFLPNEGAIDPYKLLEALTLAVQHTGNVTLIDGIANKVILSAGKTDGINTKTGNVIKANHIILTAGAYTQPLIDGIEEVKNRIPRLFNGIGYALIVETNKSLPTTVVRSPNRSLACGLHIVPRGQNRYYIGATNGVGLYSETEAPIGYTHFLLQCFIEQINQDRHDAKIIKLITGNRPVTVDTYPLIGQTSIRGLWLLTGTYRDGINCSPLLGKSIALQILDKPPLFKNIFHPEREPIQTFTQKEAIAEVTHHYMAGAYEHSMKLPRIGWDLMFKEMLHKKFEALYKDLNLDFVLPPDLLLMFDQDRQKHIDYFQKYNEKIKNERKKTSIAYQEN